MASGKSILEPAFGFCFGLSIGRSSTPGTPISISHILGWIRITSVI